MQNHDPLDRREPGEPYLIYLARDLLSSPLGRVYANLREGKFDQARQAYDTLERAAKDRYEQLPQHKRKEQSEHAWSVRGECDKMDFWRLERDANIQHTPMVLPQREDIPAFKPNATVEEIRNAKPPLDSGDGS